MDQYSTQQLKSFRDKKEIMPDEFQKDITNLQEAITHEQITNRMNSFSSIHHSISFLDQPQFMLATINIIFNEIRHHYFNEELNKRTNRERVREYYNQNRETLLEKFDCPCGGRYIRQHKARHIKSKKHQSYINGQ